jgi:glyoxylase-like metal-dependent hydrolase (beta-lactamase superfamily II)
MTGNPLRYVLVYAVEQQGGLVLVDTGWCSDDAWTALTDGLGQVGASLSAVTGVLVTHAHRDHYGLGDRIRQASGAWLAMHEVERAHLQTGRSPAAARASLLGRLLAGGVEPDVAEAVCGDDGRWERLVDVAVPDRVFRDGEIVLTEPRMRVVWTPGHTPGHSCFHDADRGLLFTGDHVLPRITPNITAREPVGADHALTHYLASLDKIAALGEPEEVLPGHEYRFQGLVQRTTALRAHHEQRLAEISKVVSHQPGVTSWEVAQRLTWSRPWAELATASYQFALGEVTSHLGLLASRGAVRATPTRPPRWHPIPRS